MNKKILIGVSMLSTLALSMPIVHGENALSGIQKVVVEGEDWGPGVSKTIIHFDKVIDASSVSKDDFHIVEEKQQYDFENNKISDQNSIVDRKILNAYTSNNKGEKTQNSEYVTVEMYISPSEGSPFMYNLKTGFNTWCNPYKLKVNLNENQTLKVNNIDYTSIKVNENIDVAGEDKYSFEADKFTTGKMTTSDGTNYSYASYTPVSNEKKKPLVIWLHGAGEGGSDPYIDLLGNKVTSLVSDKFQSLFNGAYVFVPQSPTFWMDDGTGNYQNGDKGSRYKESLFELIQTYVNNHSDIDTNRIIIGGCSNGGYMTMEMILAHPTYFAAAYPICEAFQDKYISDKALQGIKDLPIWFTYAKTDTTVNPQLTAIPTINRLKKINKKVHVSVFDKVIDTSNRFKNEDGTPYEYNGHWSWIYFDNNECIDNGLDIWTWMSKQVKKEIITSTKVNKPETTKVKTNKVKTEKQTKVNTVSKHAKVVQTSDPIYIMGYVLLLIVSCLGWKFIKKDA